MGLFRSAGARRASAGAVGRSEVFGSGRVGDAGRSPRQGTGSSCRPGTVGRSPTLPLGSEAMEHTSIEDPDLPRRRRRPAGRPRVRRADRLRAAGRRRRARADAAATRSALAGAGHRRVRARTRVLRRPTCARSASTRTPRWRRSSRRSTPSTSAPRPAAGSRGWSRPTSATASPRTSTARSSAYLDADTREAHRARPSRTPGSPTFVVERVRAAHRGRPPARRPAGAVGPAAGRRGAVARRSGWRPSATRCRRCSSAGRPPGLDLAELGRMFARLTENHTRRMARLGLSA